MFRITPTRSGRLTRPSRVPWRLGLASICALSTGLSGSTRCFIRVPHNQPVQRTAAAVCFPGRRARLGSGPATDRPHGMQQPRLDRDYSLRPAVNTDRHAIESVVFDALAEYGRLPEPDGTDSDLHDIQASY